MASIPAPPPPPDVRPASLWDAVLQAGFALAAAGGLLLAVAPDNPLLGWLDTGIARAFSGGAALSPDAEGLRRWLFTVEGATLLALGVLGLFVARVPFRRRERWARNALALSVGLWFPLDTASSLAYGVWENALLNTAIALVLLLPVAATWRRFDSPDPAPGAHPPRGVATVALLAAAFATASPATAQVQEADAGWALAGHGSFRWTHMYEDWARLAGGGVLLAHPGGTRIGLAGFGTARASRYGDLDFTIAYGGIRVERDLWRAGRWRVTGAGLVGGGRFGTEHRQRGEQAGTTVSVVEPEILLGLDAGDHFRVTLGLGYRWVGGVEGDLLNRSDGDARGGSAAVQLTVR